jgi:heme/copper-type cytochrome/quinol oxidase subunit 2
MESLVELYYNIMYYLVGILFAIPALGVKCDAYPGRLNQFSVLINRLGTFYGQCS